MLNQDLKYEKKIIFILFSMNFTHLFDFVIMMPLGPKLMRAFAIGPQQFSMLVSAYAFSSAVCGLFSSFVMDRFERKKALLFLYAGFLLGTLACGLAPNHHMLLLARTIAGGFGGVLGGLIFSLVADVVPEQRRGTANGTVLSAFGVSSVIGIPTGLYLAELFDWHAPFIFLAGLSLLVLIYTWKVMHPMPHPAQHATHESSWRKFADLFTHANHFKAFTLTIFMLFSGFIVIPFVSPYMVKNVGLPETQLPVMYFFGGLFSLVTSRLFGKLTDRLGKHKTYYLLAGLSLIPILLMTNLRPLPLPLLLIVSTLFFIFVSGRFVPAMTIISSAARPHQRGSFMSLNSAIQSIAIGLASTASGLIIGSDPQTGALTRYPIIGAISCVLTIFCFFLASRVGNGHSPSTASST